MQTQAREVQVACDAGSDYPAPGFNFPFVPGTSPGQALSVAPKARSRRTRRFGRFRPSMAFAALGLLPMTSLATRAQLVLSTSKGSTRTDGVQTDDSGLSRRFAKDYITLRHRRGANAVNELRRDRRRLRDIRRMGGERARREGAARAAARTRAQRRAHQGLRQRDESAVAIPASRRQDGGDGGSLSGA